MKKEFRSDVPKALITGFSGFTGQYVARELERSGYQVFGTVTGGERLAENVFVADLNDVAALSRVVGAIQPDVVIHLAAVSFVAHEDADAFYRVNVSGTRHLLETLARQDKKPKAVLLASSANIYGNTDSGTIDESVAPAPVNDYAVSKVAMEYVARLFMDRLPIMITRPFNYSGVGQASRFLLPKIVDHFRAGKRTIELGNVDVARDFSDVRMVAQAYRFLFEKAPAGDVFNICSGKAWTLEEVLDMMGEIAGYRISVRVNPAFVRKNEVKYLKGSPAKLKAVVPELIDIPLQETLKWMYESGATNP